MIIQKRLAAHLLNASPKRIKFDNQRIADITSAITKTDIRMLIAEGAIYKINEKGVSRSRARKIKTQKSKDRQKGTGSRKGKKTSRLPSKQLWMTKIRSQREFIRELKVKNNITNETFRELYMKSKGGFFRSTRHIKLYITENNLFTKQPKHQNEKDAKVKKAEKKEVKPKKPTKKKEQAEQQ